MPEISLFQSITEVKNPVHLDIVDFLENVRDGYWYDIVKHCRSIDDKVERDAYKDTMPRVTFSGTFSYRNNNSLIEHSGLLAMDLDDVENTEVLRNKLQNDRYVYACFLSTGGKGLRPIFRIDPKKQDEAFKGIMNYLHKEYGVVSDTNSFLSKPYIVSFDPKLFYRMDIEDTRIFKDYIKNETPVKKIANFVHTEDDFHRILKEISQRGISIAEDYNDYLKIGFAIASKYGENGREYFHEVCRHYSKYNVKDVDTQYKYCIRDQGQKKANIATFYYFAKQAGINIASETTKLIVRTTKTGKKAGLKKEQIAENLKKFNNIDGSLDIVSQIFDSQEETDDAEESILFQLEMFIGNNYHLEMNEVTGFLEQNKKQLTQDNLNSIFIAAKKVIPTVDYQLMMRLLKSEFIPKYNPFFEFFESDGIPYLLPPMPEKNQKIFNSPIIDKLAETIENDDPAYTLFFVKKWLVSIISAAHKVHSPLLLCLLGGQNTGKTEWFRRLLPNELQAYYAESKLDKEKDDELLMTENLIIMDDELGGKSKQDNLKLKNITSKQYFSLRRPYGDHNEKILRLAVLCGTSNTLQIMSDTTGNRRIIPIEVSNVNKDLYNSINKKELFLEAFRLYKEGFDWRITAEDITYLNKDQEKYEMTVAERELLGKYFEPGERHRLYVTDIKAELEILTHQRLNSVLLTRELERAEFRKISTREGKSTSKKWCVNRINRGSDDAQTELQQNTF